MQEQQVAKQSPLLRIWGWGKEEQGRLICAIAGAFIGVALGMLPYFAAARIIIKMLAGERDLSLYLPWLGVGLAGYAARTLLYNIALSVSHKATFSILKTICQKIPLEQLYDQMAFVSQDNYLFDETVRENIRQGRLSATDREVEEAAKAAGCDGFIRTLEKGYETNVGGGGAHLSGGERQRIAIARAMLKDAPIVIPDEDTANVDPENEDRLQKAIEELTRDKTIIMIAHRLKTVRNADQILVVDDGKIVQQGRHEELIGQKGIYADFVLGRKEAIGWRLGAAPVCKFWTVRE